MTDKTEVTQANEAFYRAFEKRDINAMGLVWFQGANSYCVHPGNNIIMGWESIRKSWDSIFKNTSYLEIDQEILSIEVGESLAYIIVLENVMQIAGGKNLKAQSLATNVFQKMAQKWYMVNHHASPLL